MKPWMGYGLVGVITLGCLQAGQGPLGLLLAVAGVAGVKIWQGTQRPAGECCGGGCKK